MSVGFRDWLTDTLIPDEFFYATLLRAWPKRWKDAAETTLQQDHSPQNDHVRNHYAFWYQNRDSGDRHCYGVYKRWLCNLALLDLPKLRMSPAVDHLIINKFDLEVDPLAPVCWAEHLLHREREEEKRRQRN